MVLFKDRFPNVHYRHTQRRNGLQNFGFADANHAFLGYDKDKGLRAIPFEKVVGRVSDIKNAAGWSENSSDITAGCCDMPLFEWEKITVGYSRKIATGWSEKPTSDTPYYFSNGIALTTPVCG